MSIIFGLLGEPGTVVAEREMKQLAAVTERYATGAGSMYLAGRLGMAFQPYQTHERSAREPGISRDTHGNVVSFDGRLDNDRELRDLLDLPIGTYSDSQIVLAAFFQWGEACFSRFVGDWAFALWSAKDCGLYLARDHAGTRTLHFRQQGEAMLWSTYIDSFLPCDWPLQLSSDYAACYLSCNPIRDLTPYDGLRAVRPGHYLILRDGKLSQYPHWDPVVTTAIRYNNDAEYEDEFFALFRQSVERRTGPGAPILAQLSGGMDSTAIVCMSDHIRRSNDPDAPILDTVSFYDDSEASLNEKAYFSITEAKRGQTGTHIDNAFSQRTFEPHEAADGIYLFPGADSFAIQQERRLYDRVWHKGYGSVLSGIGGDEVLGGVPIAYPELADYLVSGNLQALLRQSIAWSLVDRSPLVHELYETAKYAYRLYSYPKFSAIPVAPWISPLLRIRALEANGTSDDISSRWGIAPHRLSNGEAWWSIMETLPHLSPQILFRPEYRYPFLDKDLVTYLFSIPPDQMLRPGRRRSLMRRALSQIIPREVLERRRKAYQLRAPMLALMAAHAKLEETFATSLLGNAGFIDLKQFRISLDDAARGDPRWRQALLKTIALELWLKSIAGSKSNVLSGIGFSEGSAAAQRPSRSASQAVVSA